MGLQWLEGYGKMEGYTPEQMAMLEHIFYPRVSGEQAMKQIGAFYGRPGAVSTLGAIQQALGGLGQRPQFFGLPWEQRQRATQLGALAKQTQAQRDVAMRSAAQAGAAAPSDALLSLLGKQEAQQRGNLLSLLGTQVEGQRSQQEAQRWNDQMNLLGLLSNFVLGQPSAPFVEKQKLSPVEQFMGIATGIGSILGGGGGALAGMAKIPGLF